MNKINVTTVSLRGAHGLSGDGGRAQLRPQPGLHLGVRRGADRPAGWSSV